MKRDKFYGQIKKETEKAILVDGTWIPKSAIAENEAVVEEDGGKPFEKNGRYIKTSFPLNVSGWMSGKVTLKLESGRVVECPN